MRQYIEALKNSEPDTEPESPGIVEMAFLTEPTILTVLNAIVSLIPHCVANAQKLGAGPMIGAQIAAQGSVIFWNGDAGVQVHMM